MTEPADVIDLNDRDVTFRTVTDSSLQRTSFLELPCAVAGRPAARTLVAGATVGVLVMMGALVQITPVWLYGPAQTAAGAVPDW